MKSFQTQSRRLFVCSLAVTFAGFVTFAVSANAADKPIGVGDQAPDFELPIQGEDEFISLSELTEDGPVVVVLRGFPGYQCGICNRQVGAMVNRAKALKSALGGEANRVVLIYPGEETGSALEGRAKQFVGSRRLPEPLVMVRDPGMKMVNEWGLRWDARNETAYPSAYVIGPGRRVKWSKVSKSHGGRASVEDIVQAVKKQ